MTPSHEAAAATARLEVLFKRRGTLNRMEDHLGIRTTDRGARWKSGRRSFGATGDSARLHTRSGSSSIGLRSDTAPHAKRCQLVFRGHCTGNAPLRIASPALLETTPPRSGPAPPAGRPSTSCLPDDCDTIEPGFPVRQRDGHASRRESSACFSITRPAATRSSSASRSRSSPTHRARVASSWIVAWSARRRSSRTWSSRRGIETIGIGGTPSGRSPMGRPVGRARFAGQHLPAREAGGGSIRG